MDHYIISIDQGTSSTKCVLIRADGRIVRRINLTHRLLHPAVGFAEHDPQEIVCGIRSAIRELAEPLPSGSVAAISLSVQTGAFLLWDAESGEPLTKLIGWQDVRGEETVRQLDAAQR